MDPNIGNLNIDTSTASNAAQATVAGAAGAAGQDAPIVTAQVVDTTPLPPVSTSRVVNSVVASVSAHPDVPHDKVASIATAILGGLLQAEPLALGLSRANQKTASEVNLGFGLAEMFLRIFSGL